MTHGRSCILTEVKKKLAPVYVNDFEGLQWRNDRRCRANSKRRRMGSLKKQLSGAISPQNLRS